MDLERKSKIEKMHDSTVIFGKDGKAEGVLDPLPGQMAFEHIMSASEKELDEYIDSQLPKDVAAFQKLPYPNNDGRRVEIKRLVLARLMGFSLRGKSIQEAFDFVDTKKSTEGGDLERTLDQTLRRLLTDECKARIQEVWRNVAREAGALGLTPENQLIMDKIIEVLNKKGIQYSPPLTHLDILNIYNLPRHDVSDVNESTLSSVQWDIGVILNVYLLCLTLEEPTWDRVAERMGYGRGDAFAVRFSLTVGPRGKEILRKVRGLAYKHNKPAERRFRDKLQK